MTRPLVRRCLRLQALALLLPLLAIAPRAQAAAPAAAGAHAASPEPAADAVVATVGKEPVRYGQLLERAHEALQAQAADAEQARLRQQESAARARHAVLEEALGKWLDERALALEARATGSSADALLGAVTAAPVEEAEQEQFYEARKGESDPPWSVVEPQLGARVRQFLAAQHQEQARRAYLDGLRGKHGISASLAPYRAAVPSGGPVRGSAQARVTVLEFGDYQCPHCARAQSLVHELLAKYDGAVRVEFHQFPLERIHPDARGAAIAALCAHQQGRFWEYHDALYADPANLGSSRLQAEAVAHGLDAAKFGQCLASGAAAAAVDADLRAGAAAGVTGTPAFYVNGRPVAADATQIAQVIDAELAASRR